MAHALICDSCEAPGLYEGDLKPRGWYVVRVEQLGRTAYTVHACSSGCAIRAVAAIEHEREHPQPCRVAGCTADAQPGRELCTTHARSSTIAAERDGPSASGREHEGVTPRIPDASTLARCEAERCGEVASTRISVVGELLAVCSVHAREWDEHGDEAIRQARSARPARPGQDDAGLLCDEPGCTRLAIARWEDTLCQTRITCGEHAEPGVDLTPHVIGQEA